MAYDPVSGEWKDEETSVEKRLTGMLSKDSTYLKQGQAAGLRGAHRRGLLNSSMAVEAGEAARISAALPIASQDASQANQRTMQGRDIQAGEMTQRRGLASNEALTREGYALQRDLQSSDIASRERMQGRDIEANRANLERELGSRERLQAAENAAQKERLGMQLTAEERLALQEMQAAERRLGIELTSREQMQSADIASRERLQGADIASRERMQQADIEGQRWLAQFDAQTRERLQTLDNDTRLALQQLDAESAERVANLNVAAEERGNASRLAASFEIGYASMLETIMNNPDIPADARQAYMDHANRIRESNLALVEQFYGIDLEWENAA